MPTGNAAWLRLDKYRCDIAALDSTAVLRLTLPSGAGTLDVPAGIDYCAEAPSLTIAVSPFEPVEMLLYHNRN